jgi:serine protease Do
MSFIRRHKKTVLAGVALIAVGLLAGAWITARLRHFPFSYESDGVSAAENDIAKQVSLRTGFSPVVNKVLPAVVNVSSTKVIRSTAQSPDSILNSPFFRQFFGNDFFHQYSVPREQRQSSLGSGVITSSDGYILTNNHVIAGADQVKVALPDKRDFTARVVGTDPRSDIAVLKVDATGLPTISIGDSEKVKVGDIALAFGDPFGVGETVTMGIVSAKGRGGYGIEDYEDFIQTDAAINPGNSGGALVNVNGDLIGVNTAIISGGGGNEGVGFAIPANMARAVMDQIIKHGKVIRGWLGVTVQPVTPAIATAFKLSGTPRGALIGDVKSGSPADKGGLKQGDIILALNGMDVSDARGLSLKISQMSPGAKADLKILRDGKEVTESVTLGELPAGEGAAPQGQAPTGAGSLGMTVEPLTPDITQQLGLPAGTRGVVVTRVQPGSPADQAGLRRGDVVQEVNRAPVNNLNQFQQALRGAGNQPVLLLINRGGNSLFLAIQPPNG